MKHQRPQRHQHQNLIVTLMALLLPLLSLLLFTGCGSGGALGQLVTSAFSPQAALSDLQIKGAASGGFPIADILARFVQSPVLAKFIQPTKQEEPPVVPDGFPESAQDTEDPAPTVTPGIPTIPPEWAAILSSALEEKYILEVGLRGQKKTVWLVCSGEEEIAKCKKIEPNAPVRASVVPLDGNIYDLRRIVED